MFNWKRHRAVDQAAPAKTVEEPQSAIARFAPELARRMALEGHRGIDPKIDRLAPDDFAREVLKDRTGWFDRDLAYFRARKAWRAFEGALFGGAGFGAALGAMGGLSDGRTLIAMLLLGGIGAVLRASSFVANSSGQVQVNDDGKTRETPYYLNPSSYRPELSEIRAELDLKGITSEGIDLPPLDALPVSSPEQEVALAPELRARLIELAEQHRLVADFGQVSRHQKPAVTLIDAVDAMHLLSAPPSEGRAGSVYVVSGEPPKSAPGPSLDVRANSNSPGVSHHTEYNSTELSFRYQLHPLRSLADLEREIPPGAGVPDGMLGVYRDEPEYRQLNVYRQLKQADESATPADNGYEGAFPRAGRPALHERSKVERRLSTLAP